jgi:UDP-N-acetylmuramoyl-tripeptide--D-alanyl-D-alanine ligase
METKSGLTMADKYTWNIEKVLEATGGRLLSGDAGGEIGDIVIDSRKVKKGDLFVAIRGERFDGHTFTERAVGNGATALIVDANTDIALPLDLWCRQNIACLAVTDTTYALGRLAAYNRRRRDLTVVAITGSNGKTTTRRLTTAVGERKFETLSSMGNFNNEIGLPLSLLELGPDHRLAVLELGMNHPGEISRLGDICTPDIGLITNVGPVHLEFLGSLEGVARAKGELLDKINPGGWAVLNADDALVDKLARRVKRSCRILTFGQDPGADIRAEEVHLTRGLSRFKLRLPSGSIGVTLKIPGRVMVLNALAAAAVGHLMGLDADEIKQGLESILPAKGRMEVVTLTGGITIIDDTYNANLVSMQAALMALENLAGQGRAIFVCGDMLELGAHADELHYQLGVSAATTGCLSRIYATGAKALRVAEGARDRGFVSDAIIIGGKSDIIADLKAHLRPGDFLLVKGSRGMAMEKVVEAIREWSLGEVKSQITNKSQ